MVKRPPIELRGFQIHNIDITERVSFMFYRQVDLTGSNLCSRFGSQQGDRRQSNKVLLKR